MVVLPKDDPLFVNLNAYYLDIGRLIEHLQGEIGSGGVLFKSYSAEGALFFDKDQIINAIFQNRDESLAGQTAVELLTIADDRYNFNVSVYRIGPEDVYFWASLHTAEKIYKDLSAEFTDLDGLVKKMSSERLTGYIDVAFGGGSAQGRIFLINGKMVGAASSWSNSETGDAASIREDIVEKSKTGAARFNVCRIPLMSPEVERVDPNGGGIAADGILEALEEFLTIFEQTVSAKKRNRFDFHKMLKRKFVKNADKYAFLDPFAAEFEYEDQKITFSGHASGGELSRGVIFSVMELADDLGLRRQFSSQLAQWSARHAGKLSELDIMV